MYNLIQLFQRSWSSFSWYERVLILKKLTDNGWISPTFETDPYHFRRSPNIDHDYNREMDEIVGASVAWNQLCGIGVSSRSETRYDVEITDNRDGSYTFNGTASGGFNFNVSGTKSIISGHRYLGLINASVGLTFPPNYRTDKGNHITTANGNASGMFSVYVTSGTIFNNEKIVPMAIDLTQTFGSTIADYIYTLEQSTAGSGVSFFKKYFPQDYYAYDSGSIQSVSGLVSHDMVGKNLFDETQYQNLTTDYEYSQDTYHCKAIRLLPNTTYVISQRAGVADNNVILLMNNDKRVNNSGYFDCRTASGSKSFTTDDSGCLYIGVLYSNDTAYNARLALCQIQIELGSTASDYVAYQKNSYPLDSTVTLRGLLKLQDGKLYADGDVYKSSGEITRKWMLFTPSANEWYWSNTTRFSIGMPSGASPNDNRGAVINDGGYDRYIGGWNNQLDKSVQAFSGVIGIRDDSIADITAWRAKITDKPISFVLLLTTPTTASAEPYAKLQKVDMAGTEEYVSTSIVPIGHNTKYALK